MIENNNEVPHLKTADGALSYAVEALLDRNFDD